MLTDNFPRLERQAQRFTDARGWLEVLHESDVMVLKRSFSRAGVFRGLHYQRPPALQTKLIRVVSGRILDIVVPMDGEEQTISHTTLEPADGWVRIDAHFAHGYYALEDSLFEYICEGRYSEAAEASVSVRDYLVGMLGLPEPIISDKDRAAPALGGAA